MALWRDRWVLTIPLDPVAHLRQDAVEIIQVLGSIHRPVYVLIHDGVDGRGGLRFLVVLGRVALIA